jgi:hypothetical protein
MPDWHILRNVEITQKKRHSITPQKTRLFRNIAVTPQISPTKISDMTKQKVTLYWTSTWGRVVGVVQLQAFLTSALDRGEWSTLRPGRFTPGKDPRYPLNRRLGSPQSKSWKRKILFPLLWFQPPSVQPLITQNIYLNLSIGAHSPLPFPSLMIYLLNWNWVATRWQQYSTHFHTNSTQNDTKILEV